MQATTENRFSGKVMEYFVRPCATASFFVFVALLWTLLLQHVIAYPFVFLFFGAIMGSAWFGGIIAGFMAVVLSSVVVTYFFVPPLFSMSVAKDSQSFLAAFIVCAIAITIVSSARKRAENAIRISRDQLEAKVQERTAELQQSQSGDPGKRAATAVAYRGHSTADLASDAAGRIEYCNQSPARLPGKTIEMSAERRILQRDSS